MAEYPIKSATNRSGQLVTLTEDSSAFHYPYTVYVDGKRKHSYPSDQLNDAVKEFESWTRA